MEELPDGLSSTIRSHDPQFIIDHSISGVEINPGPNIQTDEQIAGVSAWHILQSASMPTWLSSWWNRLSERKLQHIVPCVFFSFVGGIAKDWYENSRADTVGSCSMLPPEDGGVVHTKLKVCPKFWHLYSFTPKCSSQVYHTTNIWVVDLSILPLHIGAHMQCK